jgi:hypothetical protein
MTIILMLTGISQYVKNKDFQNHETESNLLIMNDHEEYDILFMGISHTRNFSRHKNHTRIEKILSKTIINIGQGDGMCGANEQLFYLDYFYYKKNTASTVVYFISPPMFFSTNLPISSKTFIYEPFKLDFFLRYLIFPSENKIKRINSYLRSKLTWDWYSYEPFSLDSKDERLTGIDSAAVFAGQKKVYQNASALERFYLSVPQVEEAIRLAVKNKSRVILIIPPALFGKWIGHENVEKFAKEMEQINGVEFYDLSESIMSPEYYYDHHHLNTDGIILFTNEYLNPILNSTPK